MKFAAVICLGAVIRGDTDHYEYIAGEAARGVMEASLTTGVPIIFGILTCATEEQALDRIGEHEFLTEQTAGEVADQALAAGQQYDHEANHHAWKREREGQHGDQYGPARKAVSLQEQASCLPGTQP